MRIEELTDKELQSFYDTARTQGIDYFDHADAYGTSPHACEARFAQGLKLSPVQREEIILQTKCGIIKDPLFRFDFSYEHIVETVNDSLKALNTDYIDVLLLHRPDPLVEPEEVARAFDELSAQGKVQHFGVSNHTPGQVEWLKTCVTQPLVANQMQLSITEAQMIATGMTANMGHTDQAIQRHDDILTYSQLNDIQLQAWSPMQKGFFEGVFIDDPELPALNAELQNLADKYGVTKEGIATAWILRHPAHMQVVSGTTTPKRLEMMAAGTRMRLERLEWWQLFHSAGHLVP